MRRVVQNRKQRSITLSSMGDQYSGEGRHEKSLDSVRFGCMRISLMRKLDYRCIGTSSCIGSSAALDTRCSARWKDPQLKIHLRRRDLTLALVGKLQYGASRTIICPKSLAISSEMLNSQEMEFATISCLEIRKSRAKDWISRCPCATSKMATVGHFR